MCLPRHQGHLVKLLRFGALVINFLEYFFQWQSCNLQCIPDHSNRLVKSKSVSHPLAIDELSTSVKTENFEIGVLFSQLRSDLLIYVVLFMHHKHSGSDEIDNDLNFACVGYSFTFI